ncbi:MAG: hypothetical protein J6R42_05285 [Clostridia bacterium]|nr:hypothetical protein [Clostridia bacterium]
MDTAANWDFTLSNYDDVWRILVQVGLLLIFLLIGNLLRNIVPFFRKCLIPSALLGGALLLLVDYICKQFGFMLVDNHTMQVITYHGLGLGFAAMTLKTEKTKCKIRRSQTFEFGVLQGGTYMLQAWTGLAVTLAMYFITVNGKNVISYISGILLPLAFGQGPGNALAWDIDYSNLSQTQFYGNGSFGLSLASIGFIVASVIGVLHINISKSKGQIKLRKEKRTSMEENAQFAASNEIPNNESVDKFSIQMGFVALAYAMAFGIMCIFAVLSDFTNGIAWGFNFLWAALSAMLIKVVFRKLRKRNIVKREYINNYQMDRISGFAFDLMIVAGVAAIEINDIKNYVLPIAILTVVGTITTYFYIRKVAKHCFPEFQHEFFLMSFGTLTGTASNGVILLKEVDPEFETPVADLYIKSTVPAMLMVAPLLFLLGFAGKSLVNTIIAFGVFFLLFCFYTLFLFRKKIFKKKPKDDIDS